MSQLLKYLASELRALPSRHAADDRPIEAFSIPVAQPVAPTEMGAVEVPVFGKDSKKQDVTYMRMSQRSLTELAKQTRSVAAAGVGVHEERAFPDHDIHKLVEEQRLGTYIQQAGVLLLQAVRAGGFKDHTDLRDLILKTEEELQGKGPHEFAFGPLGAIYAGATYLWLWERRPEFRPFAEIGKRRVPIPGGDVVSFGQCCEAFAELLEADAGGSIDRTLLRPDLNDTQQEIVDTISRAKSPLKTIEAIAAATQTQYEPDSNFRSHIATLKKFRIIDKRDGIYVVLK